MIRNHDHRVVLCGSVWFYVVPVECIVCAFLARAIVIERILCVDMQVDHFQTKTF